MDITAIIISIVVLVVFSVSSCFCFCPQEDSYSSEDDEYIKDYE